MILQLVNAVEVMWSEEHNGPGGEVTLLKVISFLITHIYVNYTKYNSPELPIY